MNSKTVKHKHTERHIQLFGQTRFGMPWDVWCIF